MNRSLSHLPTGKVKSINLHSKAYTCQGYRVFALGSASSWITSQRGFKETENIVYTPGILSSIYRGCVTVCSPVIDDSWENPS